MKKSSTMKRTELMTSTGLIEYYKDVSGKWRFRVKAANYKIIAVSEGYNSKQACMNGIKSLLRHTENVEIVEV